MVLRLLRLPYVAALVGLHLSSALLAAPLQLYLLVLHVRTRPPPHTCYLELFIHLLVVCVSCMCRACVVQAMVGPKVLARSRAVHAALWLPRCGRLPSYVMWLDPGWTC
jgi:hypothetical protein